MDILPYAQTKRSYAHRYPWRSRCCFDQPDKKIKTYEVILPNFQNDDQLNKKHLWNAEQNHVRIWTIVELCVKLSIPQQANLDKRKVPWP